MSTFGNNTSDASDSQDGGGIVRGAKFTLTQHATITALDLYCRINAAGTVKLITAVYTNNGGVPDILLGQSVEVSITNTVKAWVNLPVSATFNLDPGDYWLVWENDGGTGGGGIWYGESVASQRVRYTGNVYPTLPSPFGTTAAQDQLPDIYAEYVLFSASSSPSLSGSNSASASGSSSKSPSSSSSPSPSASKSPSASLSISPSASKSPSASASRSASPSFPVSFYSRQATVGLPISKADLSTVYSAAEVVKVATDDGLRVDVEGGLGTYLIHEFKLQHLNSHDTININIDLQTTLAPSTSTIYLQIWNKNTSAWETLASDSTSTVNADFQMTGIVATNLSNYYDDLSDIFGSYDTNEVACRVYQNNP